MKMEIEKIITRTKNYIVESRCQDLEQIISGVVY